MKKEIINRLLNFFGTFLAVVIWMTIILSLDVSSPIKESALSSTLISSFWVAVFFLVADFVLRFAANYFFSKELLADRKLLKEIWDVFWYSLNGSLSGVLFLIFLLHFNGYIKMQFVLLELMTSLVIGFILFAAVFTFVFPLRMIAYFVKSVIESYRNQLFLK